jgi:hypothetical protein
MVCIVSMASLSKENINPLHPWFVWTQCGHGPRQGNRVGTRETGLYLYDGKKFITHSEYKHKPVTNSKQNPK